MEELFLEMDFLLTYDKQPHPIRIPYRFFYSSEANQNYFEFRDSMMQICYNDYSYRLKRLNVDRKKTRCYVIINDTIVVVNDPEFFNVKSDNHEPILVRSSKYPLAVLDKPKTESSSFSFWDWFHIILLIMGIIFTLVYALFLTFIMHEKFIKSEELNLSLKETIELVFFWFFSICVTFFNIHILFVYFS